MPNKGYKILAVDDDPKVLLLVEAILKPHGYDVVMLNDGKRMIETARKETPDLILLDIMMRFEDGYTLLSKIKKDENSKNIPVVMVTALELDGNKVIANICGASAYVTKPIDRQALINTITRLLPDSA